MTTISLKTWLMAFRPKTLTASIAPVLIGTAMAYGDGIAHIPTAILCFIAALSIQIGTNLANDYFDFVNGADTPDRIGPTRVTQAGLIKPETVKLSFILAFLISIIVSFFIYQRAGQPVLIIGIISILSGIFYTAGPRPLGYLGLGDLFVLIFFGPVAVAGTYFVQSLEINMAVVLAGLAPGFISVAILAVNNLRDIDSDRRAKKHTLAVRFGASFARSEYMFSIFTAATIPVLIVLLIEDHYPILLCSLISFLAIPGIKKVCGEHNGPQLNSALAFTGKLLLIYSIGFSYLWLR